MLIVTTPFVIGPSNFTQKGILHAMHMYTIIGVSEASIFNLVAMCVCVCVFLTFFHIYVNSNYPVCPIGVKFHTKVYHAML